MNSIAVMRSFWARFATTLYDTGFAFVVDASGANIAQTEQEMMSACSFILGACMMAQLSTEKNGSSWRMARSVGIIAGSYIASIQVRDNESDVALNTETFSAELGELIWEN